MQLHAQARAARTDFILLVRANSHKAFPVLSQISPNQRRWKSQIQSSGWNLLHACIL